MTFKDDNNIIASRMWLLGRKNIKTKIFYHPGEFEEAGFY
jgi:hypothetical protein